MAKTVPSSSMTGVQSRVRTEMIGPARSVASSAIPASTSQRQAEQAADKVGAAVALPAGFDDLRNQHHIEHPARQQQVDDVRDGVGLLEDVAHRRVGTDGDGEQGGPDEAQDPGHHGSGRHDGTGLGRAVLHGVSAGILVSDIVLYVLT